MTVVLMEKRQRILELNAQRLDDIAHTIHGRRRSPAMNNSLVLVE